MNKTHYFAFVAGIIAAVLWIGAPYDSGTELIYLVVGLFVFGWAFDRLFEMRWGWLLAGFHRAFCVVGVHDYKSYLDGLFCVWCHKQRHMTEAEIAKVNEEKVRLKREFKEIAEPYTRSYDYEADNSDLDKAQPEVRKGEKLLRALIDHSVNGIVRFRWGEDEDGENALVSIFANSAAGRFLGSDADDLVDRVAPELIRLATSGMDGEAADDIVRRFEVAVSRGDSLDIEVHRFNQGEDRWLRMICEPVGDDFATTFVDISDSKVKEQKMESIAFSDPLTSALNRRGFERAAAGRLTASDDDATGALLFIDLKDFTQIDDKYGHEIGDQLLRIAAERLRKSLRSHDIVGRWRGCQFVALVPDVNADIADKISVGLAQGLEEPYVIGDKTLRCAASIGLALYPDNANTLRGLIREAHALRGR